jgi:hypothetical protein
MKWSIVCQQGSMGSWNSKFRNLKSMSAKWLFELINENGLWQKIIRNKYLTGQTIGMVERTPGDSHFWSGLMKAKEAFLMYGSFRLNNRKQIQF